MIIRVAICIPTFNNPLSIQDAVKSCLLTTEFPLLVVDDGSDVPVLDLFTDPLVRNALATGRVQVFCHSKNLGKGKALQTGFEKLGAAGFTHMVAMDGDGQHLATEIRKLVDLTLIHPWDLIIGNRKLISNTVPGISKFGRNFSNFWVGFQTDIKVCDSQSGFRIYPLFHVQNMKFWTKKFDFEIEVLIRLLWKGVNVRETLIEVYYPPPELRVSHFNKFWDNVKISFLNTVLVILSLLKSHRSPRKLALAIGTGVAIGCTPFFGFHTLIVAAVSFVFRLNAVYLWLGSQISIPPLAPILLMGSLVIGRLIYPGVSNNILGLSVHWLVGSFVLGAGLGLLAGFGSYFVSIRFKSKSTLQQKTWTGKTRGGVFGNWFLKTLVKNFGLAPAYFCLYFIVPYFYLFAPSARRASSEYWKVLYPKSSVLTRQRLIMGQFFIYAQILLDRLFQSFSNLPLFNPRPHGFENIAEAIKSKNGLVLMTAHVGGWDISSAHLATKGYSGDFHLVQYESSGLTFNKIKGTTDSTNQKALSANVEVQPILKIRQWLAEGKPVGLMGDRPLGNQFELVPFFGKLAPIDCTPFRIAAACQASLLFTFAFKGSQNNYDFFATKAKRLVYEKSTTRQSQCFNWAKEYTEQLEYFLRKYPKQWANFYPFWSIPPRGSVQSESMLKSQNYLAGVLNKQTSPELGSEFEARSTSLKVSLH